MRPRSSRRRPALAAVALAVAGTGTAVAFGAPAHAIADGSDVPDGSYRFVADLEARGIPTVGGGTRDSACSAALVAPQWIVSAGHCFHDGDPAGRVPTSGRVGPGQAVPYSVIVVVGRATRSGGDGDERQVVSVQQVPVPGTDLAVARLDEPVLDVEPVRLAEEPVTEGETVRLAGWGATSSPATPQSRPDRMQTGLFEIGPVTATSFQARGVEPAPTTSPCPYDSGAPYFRETDAGPELVGAESGGPRCPHDRYDTATRTDWQAVRAWIAARRLPAVPPALAAATR